METEKAKQIVEALLHDFTDRKGFRQIWESCDQEVQEELRNTWKQIIIKQLQSSSSEPVRHQKYPIPCPKCASPYLIRQQMIIISEPVEIIAGRKNTDSNYKKEITIFEIKFICPHCSTNYILNQE